MPLRMVFDAGITADGSLAVVVTDGACHAVYAMRSGVWESICQWTGDEVSAFCICGNTVVVADGSCAIHVIQEGKRNTISVGEIQYVFGAAPLADDAVLLAGSYGRLAIVNLTTGGITSDSLRNHGVSKPGRTVYRVRPTEEGFYLLGDNKLLVRCRGTQWEELLLPGEPTERRFALYYLEHLDGDIILSGLLDVKPTVAVLSDGALSFLDTPTLGEAAPPLFRLGATTFLLTTDAWAIRGRTFVSEHHVAPPDSLVWLGAQPNGCPGALSESGAFYENDGQEWVLRSNVPAS